jgi:hypothetical protein
MKTQDNSPNTDQSSTAITAGANVDGLTNVIFPADATDDEKAQAIFQAIVGREGGEVRLPEMSVQVDTYGQTAQAARLVTLCQVMASEGIRLSHLSLIVESGDQEASAKALVDALEAAGLTPEVVVVEHERAYFDQALKRIVYKGESI